MAEKKIKSISTKITLKVFGFALIMSVLILAASIGFIIFFVADEGARESFGLTPVAVFAAFIFIIIIIFFILVRSVVKKSISPINSISEIMQNVARGDFSQHIEHEADDEIGEIVRNSNTMIEQSSRTIELLKTAITSLGTTSEELMVTAMSLGDNSKVQADSVNEIAVELNLVIDSIKETVDFIGEQVGDVSKTAELISGLEDMSSRITGNMEKVRKQSETSINISSEGANLVESTGDAMKLIVESSRRIAGMVNIINDISDKINLLSLNASIEAARAGDAGKGFAVVAEEIGKLADNTSNQVKEIHSLSAEIQKSVQHGNNMVEKIRNSISSIKGIIIDNSKLIEEIDSLTFKQAENHDKIRSAMNNLEQKAKNIISVSNFQKSNSESMKKAMERILEFAMATKNGANEISETSEELSSDAEKLNQLIDGFRIVTKEKKKEDNGSGTAGSDGVGQ